jgi:FtsP/CotA-like multicopper oxidase with cupredoxin domain
MTRKTQLLQRRARLLRVLAVLAPLPLALPQALAAEVWLRAGSTTQPRPGGGAAIPMWGYAQCTAGFASCGPVTVPGPVLTVPATDAGLTVHLGNALPEPTSLVIPGQTATMTPVWFDPADPGVTSSGARPGPAARVRSFTHEVPPDGTADYVWPTLRPGTYLYESGTHPQVQVQMGLYGALVHDAVDAVPPARAQAYAGVEYDQAVTVVYGEIDPALHDAVDTGAYGTTGPTSTFDYQPKYFLVNGAPYAAGAPPLATVGSGTRTLLRFVNAGLRSHVPMLLGAHLELVAEDGRPYPWPAHPRQQYTALLPAAKALDAIVTPVNFGSGEARLAILDRRLDVTNAGVPDGGLIAFLAVAASVNQPPTITSTPVTTASQGEPWAYPAIATDPDPGDAVAWSLDVFPAGMTVSPGGLVQWTPVAGQAGPHPVTVRATDLGGLFATQSFTVTVAAVNHPPVAANDGPFSWIEGSTFVLGAPGVLGNDTDPDGDALTAVDHSAGVGTLTGNPDGSFAWALPLGSAGTRTFTYRAEDEGGARSGLATVTVTVLANRPPLAVDDRFTAPRRTSTNAGAFPVALAVLANDLDPDTAIDPGNRIAPATVVITAKPNKGGVATVGANGTVSYTPKLNFKGTDTFRYTVRDTRGAVSTAGTVRVNVQ